MAHSNHIAGSCDPHLHSRRACENVPWAGPDSGEANCVRDEMHFMSKEVFSRTSAISHPPILINALRPNPHLTSPKHVYETWTH